jgi:hypothetical protein
MSNAKILVPEVLNCKNNKTQMILAIGTQLPANHERGREKKNNKSVSTRVRGIVLGAVPPGDHEDEHTEASQR